MKIIDNNKINLLLLQSYIKKPKIFEKSTDKFWDDDYIGMQMLKLHLTPDIESASKTKETIGSEACFIINLTDMDKEKTVLDLGCGPGLYVREFAKTQASVTGIDFSEVAIDYANKNIKSEYNNTNFIKQNYLDMDFENCFDIVTLIFYDFCALNTTEQTILLKKVHAALKYNGFFIFDVVSENKDTPILTSISVHEEGFWSPKQYIEIFNAYMYEKPKTEGLQYTIIDEEGNAKVIRIYHRLFELAEITKMLNKSGFKVEKIYKNLKGELLMKDCDTFGIIARKL